MDFAKRWTMTAILAAGILAWLAIPLHAGDEELPDVGTNTPAPRAYEQTVIARQGVTGPRVSAVIDFEARRGV